MACTAITLFHCTAEIRAFKCHEKFFGSTSKDYSVKPLIVSDRACKNAVKTHVSHFGPLFPQTYNTWTKRNNDHYSCSWMKTKTNHFKHFTVKAYHGELVGDDLFLHQSLTHAICHYHKFFCVPPEFPLSKIFWSPV